MSRSSPCPEPGLSERELATVLAAMRYWQRTVPDLFAYAASPLHFRSCRPLSSAEIDALCEKLNLAK